VKTERRTARFFDSYAREFDAIFTNRGSIFTRTINHFFRKSTRLRYLKTLEECRPIEGKTVLDIGCGPGHYGAMLARMGAARVVGIDFSGEMIRLAEASARRASVEKKCQFVQADFLNWRTEEKFDYVIAQGFMDYVPDAGARIEKILFLTRSKVFFSFPKDGGFLAWQRKLRYKWKCDLFLYRREQVEKLFEPWRGQTKIEQISRDFFVTVDLTP
jgi:2-polyprenyl-3-methyl-5-hydroxy-6-metoxy-1,4-benzoquinol methylase